MNYQAIKQLANENGVRVTDLIALASKNDPFYADMPSSRRAAEWFADVWDTAGFTDGVHLRRVHYWLEHRGHPLPRPITWKRKQYSTDVYINNEPCWKFLCDAAKPARYLGLVPVGSVIDKKHPAPHVFAEYSDLEPDYWVKPPKLSKPDISVWGFGVQDVQPYHLEVWCEKSTMDDVLIPVCRLFGANLSTFVGEVSVYACHALLDRIVEAYEKPARIFYISDFDPAGNSMPVGMSRKVEFLNQHLDLAIKIKPLALTKEQVIEYQLPRMPIKESESRAGTFEAAFGEGATELDALEALHPGTLYEIVADALQPYWDREAANKAREQAQGLRRAVREEIDAITSEYTAEIAALDPMFQRIGGVKIDAEEYQVERAEPHVSENGSWLFDSGREYVDQIVKYKQHKGIP